MTFEQRLELVDIELKEIGKIIEEMAEALDNVAKSIRRSND